MNAVPAIFFMVLSAASFSFMAATVRWLLPETPSQAIVFSRGVMVSAILVVIATRRRVSLLGRRRGLLLVRGLLGSAALSIYYWSAQTLPIGDAILIQYTHPLWVALLAPWLLREVTSGRTYRAAVLGLVGVAFVVRPEGQLSPAAMIALGGAVLSALAYMTVRRLSETESRIAIMFWFPAVSVLFALPGTWSAGASALPRCGREVVGHLLVTGSALLGQWAITLGLSRAGAARATAATLTGPLFGMVLGWLLLSQVPSGTSLIGGALILTGLYVLARPVRSRS